MQISVELLTGFSYGGRADSYQMSTWSLGEKYIQEYNGWFLEQQTQFLLGRYHHRFVGDLVTLIELCWVKQTSSYKLLNLVSILSLVLHPHFEALEFLFKGCPICLLI